jgi:hypothetical protein
MFHQLGIAGETSKPWFTSIDRQVRQLSFSDDSVEFATVETMELHRHLSQSFRAVGAVQGFRRPPPRAKSTPGGAATPFGPLAKIAIEEGFGL